MTRRWKMESYLLASLLVLGLLAALVVIFRSGRYGGY
jgi:hypothetical protein